MTAVGTVKIRIAAYGGSGCPVSTTTVPSVELIPLGNSGFDVLFDNYRALVGVGATPVDFRRNCQVTVAVEPPAGYSYTIAPTGYRAYVDLALGAAVTYRTFTYFAGQPGSAPQVQTVPGPARGNVPFPLAADPATVWSPCGRVLLYNINTDIRVSAGTSDVRRATSSAFIDGADDFAVRWQRCTT